MTGNETNAINNATNTAENSAESFAARLAVLEHDVKVLIQIANNAQSLDELLNRKTTLINEKVDCLAKFLNFPTTNSPKETNS
jgi:hypothetical protein